MNMINKPMKSTKTHKQLAAPTNLGKKRRPPLPWLPLRLPPHHASTHTIYQHRNPNLPPTTTQNQTPRIVKPLEFVDHANGRRERSARRRKGQRERERGGEARRGGSPHLGRRSGGVEVVSRARPNKEETGPARSRQNPSERASEIDLQTAVGAEERRGRDLRSDWCLLRRRRAGF